MNASQGIRRQRHHHESDDQRRMRTNRCCQHEHVEVSRTSSPAIAERPRCRVR